MEGGAWGAQEARPSRGATAAGCRWFGLGNQARVEKNVLRFRAISFQREAAWVLEGRGFAANGRGQGATRRRTRTKNRQSFSLGFLKRYKTRFPTAINCH